MKLSLSAALLFELVWSTPVPGKDARHALNAGSPHVVRHSSADAGDNSAVVDLGYAKYQGVALDGGVTKFLGMRFAAPPVGDRRWRAPQDPIANHTIQNASQFGATCIGLVGPPLTSTTNEDCLFLNVWKPTHAGPDAKLPVWFFIQGGGYAGNTDQNFNVSDVIVQSNHSILFVQINYRVGVFGFLASEKIRENGDLNVGLLDQRFALHWAQKYIHLFGGDPNHVVIHGDSAGGGSVAYQLTAYGGRNDGLFVGGISESPFWPTHRTVAESEFQFDRFAANVSCSDASDVLACLRALDTSALQASDVASKFPDTTVNPDWYFLPVVDGNFSTDLHYNLFQQGKFVDVPMIVGDDTDEGTAFSPNASSSQEVLAFIKANYPNLNGAELQLINHTYPPDILPRFENHTIWFTSAELAYGEATFTCPGIVMSSSAARRVSPSKSWNYRYNVIDQHNIATGAGVPHVFEKPAIWGVNSTGPCRNCSYETYNAPIVPIVMDYVLSFIVSLNPNTHKNAAAPMWEPWGSGSGQRLKLETNATAMEAVPGDQLQRCAIWQSLASVTEQ